MQGKKDQGDVLKQSFEDDPRVKWIPPEEWLKQGRSLGLNMAEKFTRWDASDHLKTEEDIMAYFEACLDDDPGDGSLVRAALGDIAKAGNMSKLAREIGLSREGLYRALSTDGNPEFATIMKVIKGLGLRLHAGRTRHSKHGAEA